MTLLLATGSVACVGGASTWDADYGKCDTYAGSKDNHEFCQGDCNSSKQACEECCSCSKSGISKPKRMFIGSYNINFA